MELKFLKNEQGELFESRPVSIHAMPPPNRRGEVEALGEFVQFGDAPACNICGSLMVRSGTCYRCNLWHRFKRLLLAKAFYNQ